MKLTKYLNAANPVSRDDEGSVTVFGLTGSQALKTALYLTVFYIVVAGFFTALLFIGTTIRDSAGVLERPGTEFASLDVGETTGSTGN